MFQKRLDGSVDFVNRGWADYKHGFGNLNGEFWLRLDKIHRLTKTKSRLQVELEDTQGKIAYAEYDMFSVSSERNKYRLGLGIYTGECSLICGLVYFRESCSKRRNRIRAFLHGSTSIHFTHQRLENAVKESISIHYNFFLSDRSQTSSCKF